jgi:predicted dehydrogenase
MIRVAVVGVGGMAKSYRQVYAQLPGVEWALAVDVNDAELEASRGQGARRVSTRFEDALADDIDMVDISTPNHLHEQQAVAALRAGKHVLLQKPMANTLAAADSIVAAARQAKGTLGMYMSGYTNPLMWEIRSLIDAGALGRIQSIRARDAHRGGLRQRDAATNWRRSRELTGGGSFIQLSIHAINHMQWWLQTPITEVMAYSDNQYCPNIGGDDVTLAIARFGERYYGGFDSGYASDGMTREIYGDKGHVILSNWDKELAVVLDGPYRSDLIRYEMPGEVLRVPAPAFSLSDAANPLNQQRMFIDAIREGRKPFMSGEQGRQDLAVVMAVYQSARERRPVAVA